MKDMKVLLHITEDNRWGVAMGNIINFLKDVGEDRADVVIVANGPAVASYLTEDKMMAMLAEKGVQFKACKNSLKRLCTGGKDCDNESNLPPFVKVIPAGISEIVRKQQEGYVYVRP